MPINHIIHLQNHTRRGRNQICKKEENGFGTARPPIAIRHQAAAMDGWLDPSHSPWACALECSSPSPHPSPCLLFPFLIDLLIGINHQLSRQTFDRTLSFSLVFLCLDLGRVFLSQKLCQIWTPRVCIYRPEPTSNRLDEQAQPVGRTGATCTTRTPSPKTAYNRPVSSSSTSMASSRSRLLLGQLVQGPKWSDLP